MRQLALAMAISGIVLGGSAKADVELTYHSSQEPMVSVKGMLKYYADSYEYRIYVTDHGLRIERPHDEKIFIVETNTIYAMDLDNHYYYRVDDALRAKANQLMIEIRKREAQQAAPALPPVLPPDMPYVPTGQTERVASRNCRTFRHPIYEDMTAEVCFAPSPELGLTATEETVIGDYLKVQPEESLWRISLSPVGFGYTVRSIVFDGSKRVSELSLVAVKHLALPKDILDVPSGFTEQKLRLPVN